MSSPIFAQAAAIYKTCRAEYGDYLESQYSRASDDCNGALLNARGTRRQVNPFNLFLGNEITAHAYASEELIQWWAEHGRMTFATFEEQWFEQPEEA